MKALLKSTFNIVAAVVILFAAIAVFVAKNRVGFVFSTFTVSAPKSTVTSVPSANTLR